MFFPVLLLFRLSRFVVSSSPSPWASWPTPSRDSKGFVHQGHETFDQGLHSGCRWSRLGGYTADGSPSEVRNGGEAVLAASEMLRVYLPRYN